MSNYLDVIFVTPAMLSIIKRSDLAIPVVGMKTQKYMKLLNNKEVYGYTFMGKDIVLDATVREKYDNEFYSVDLTVNGILQNTLNKYLEKIHFYYCPICQIMRLYYNTEPESMQCCTTMKDVDTKIGLSFFELHTIIHSRSAVKILEVPREELLIHLI